jgi:16S rRNA G966 N2-methylase RsmD
MANRLYFGDNLGWLRNTKEFPDASVDLVYLDPPFNSNATTIFVPNLPLVGLNL